MERVYYRYIFRLKSPLALGSGISDNTDSDVLLDSRGVPYIPATSIAGVIRHSVDEDTARELFGTIQNGSGEMSKVLTYDAVCTGENSVSVRDSVRLNNKVAEDTGKFDFEAVETGAEFRGYIELADCGADGDSVINEAFQKINAGLLRFGHKTTRGYGTVAVEGLQRIGFSDADAWLDFDMFDDECWKNAQAVELTKPSDLTGITLSLKQRGGISIRRYSTDVSDGENAAPDYEQLSLRSGVPVIPGTSWAGAFRARFCEFAGEEKADGLFGHIEENVKQARNKKSAIYFSESMLDGGYYKTVTRNSIDRFTSGTNDGALYTEKTYYGGSTELELLFTEKQSDDVKRAVLAVIADLDNGFLSVGGLTSVGRGLFSVEKLCINGQDMTESFRNYDFDKLLEVW